MSTAEQTMVEEELEAAGVGIQLPERVAIFMSYRSELRLTMVARQPIFNLGATPNVPVGQPIGRSTGISIGFRDGVLRIPLDTTDGKIRGVDTLDAGNWELDRDVVLDWLRTHPMFGNRQEGFWEVPQEAPAVSDREIEMLTNAALALDINGLREFIAVEKSGWAREALLDRAEKTLEKMEAIHKEAAEQAAAAERERADAEKLRADETAVKAAETASAAPVAQTPSKAQTTGQTPPDAETTGKTPAE